MQELTENENILKMTYKGKEYQIIYRLVAYYLSRYMLRKEKYDSIQEADKLLWVHYHFYMNNPEFFELEARHHSDFIVNNYIKYS